MEEIFVNDCIIVAKKSSPPAIAMAVVDDHIDVRCDRGTAGMMGHIHVIILDGRPQRVRDPVGYRVAFLAVGKLGKAPPAEGSPKA